MITKLFLENVMSLDYPFKAYKKTIDGFAKNYDETIHKKIIHTTGDIMPLTSNYTISNVDFFQGLVDILETGTTQKTIEKIFSNPNDLLFLLLDVKMSLPFGDISTNTINHRSSKLHSAMYNKRQIGKIKNEDNFFDKSINFTLKQLSTGILDTYSEAGGAKFQRVISPYYNASKMYKTGDIKVNSKSHPTSIASINAPLNRAALTRYYAGLYILRNSDKLVCRRIIKIKWLTKFIRFYKKRLYGKEKLPDIFSRDFNNIVQNLRQKDPVFEKHISEKLAEFQKLENDFYEYKNIVINLFKTVIETETFELTVKDIYKILTELNILSKKRVQVDAEEEIKDDYVLATLKHLRQLDWLSILTVELIPSVLNKVPRDDSKLMWNRFKFNKQLRASVGKKLFWEIIEGKDTDLNSLQGFDDFLTNTNQIFLGSKIPTKIFTSIPVNFDMNGDTIKNAKPLKLIAKHYKQFFYPFIYEKCLSDKKDYIYKYNERNRNGVKLVDKVSNSDKYSWLMD